VLAGDVHIDAVVTLGERGHVRTEGVDVARGQDVGPRVARGVGRLVPIADVTGRDHLGVAGDRAPVFAGLTGAGEAGERAVEAGAVQLQTVEGGGLRPDPGSDDPDHLALPVLVDATVLVPRPVRTGEVA